MALVSPSSLLLFLVSSSVWLSLPLPVATEDGQGGGQCPPQLCGNVNISFPFGLIPQTNCSAVTGLQVRCTNNIPSLGSFQKEHGMQILNIFYHNNSLLVADAHWQGYFNSSTKRCSTFPTDPKSRLALPLSVGPYNQSLVFYKCNKPPSSPPGGGLVETVCNNTFVRAAGGPSDESGSYLEGCTTAMVPVAGVSGNMSASDYQQLVLDGYLVTWQLPSPPAGNFALGTSSIIPNLSMALFSS